MEYRHLFRNVEKTVASIESGGTPTELVIRAAEELLKNFGKELHLSGYRIYMRDGQKYQIVHYLGNIKPVPEGYEIPVSYPPIEQVLDNGIALLDRNSPGIDPRREEKLGVNQYAAICVGGGSFIISFSFRGKVIKEWIYYTLNIVRHAISHKLQEEAHNDLMNEARLIQESILPKKHPNFEGFDIFGVSEPAERVGGDYFDYIPTGEKALGLSIGDATGHGLPSALLIRDVYVGLRMGMTRDFKITRTLEKLNQIIARGKMTSRFVSLFFGELESNGLMIYVNAGHNTPYILADSGWICLTERGLILGPIPDVTYQRGMAHLQPGSILLLYTDGIVETQDPEGEMFGEERLQECVYANRELTAEKIAQKVFDAVDSFQSGGKPQDDRTLVICKRLL